MKNSFKILSGIFLILVFSLFVGCETEEEAALYVPTAAEVENIVLSAIGSLFVPMDYLDGAFDGAAGVAIVTGTDTASITFTDYAWPTGSMTLNGSLSLSMSGGSYTATFTSLQMAGTPPGAAAAIAATISGTFAYDPALPTYTVSFSISGLTAEPVTVNYVLQGDPPTVISATINGYDHKTDFTNALAEM